MKRNRVFFAFASLFACIAVFILLVPTLVTPDLVRPDRVDSTYIEFQREQLFIEQPQNFKTIDSTLFFNPGDLGMAYEAFDVMTFDSLILRGWYIADDDSNANTILLLHEWNESKILKLNLAKQLHDRGFHVCLIDLRAHGSSDGLDFSPGIALVTDVKSMLDSLLARPGTNHIAIFGEGLSAGIALQSALFDGRADALVLQCPFNRFSTFVEKYARQKWGMLQFIFFPVLKRKIEDMIQMPLANLRLDNFSSLVETPTQFIAVDGDAMYTAMDAYAVYDSSAAEKKELILVRNSNRSRIEPVGGEGYYNSIAAFLSAVLPKKLLKTRIKKMT